MTEVSLGWGIPQPCPACGSSWDTDPDLGVTASYGANEILRLRCEACGSISPGVPQSRDVVTREVRDADVAKAHALWVEREAGP